MEEDTFQLVKTIAFVGSLSLVLLLEVVARWGRFDAKRLRNVPLAVLDAAVLAFACGTCAWSVSRWSASHDVGLLNAFTAPAWLAIPMTIVALDFVSYVWHRANHRVAWLWRLHAVHHSDPAFDLTTSLRFHPGELLLSIPLRLAAAVALGAPVAGILVFETVFGFFNLLEHGNVRLPERLERVLSGIVVHPALHRIHHSVRPEELNRNFGTIFTFWDRLFGTFHDARSGSPVRIGLAGLRARGTFALLALPFAFRYPARPSEVE